MTPEGIERVSHHWPKTPGGYKVSCPDCGKTGYPGGTWTHAHLHHINCVCGGTITARGYPLHRSRYCNG